jgi:hypothetical protein
LALATGSTAPPREFCANAGGANASTAVAAVLAASEQSLLLLTDGPPIVLISPRRHAMIVVVPIRQADKRLRIVSQLSPEGER